ncbi:protein-L-isoaspartate(D-aspartate) o-methyltransferase (PCMT) domain-containing protein [Sarocladium implicatum]|nr:protein-L-isoaspartate(D-aspartate) o-methyltransferase (PCMT) domain-containing protein [Sarocladium implicatum]
MAWHCSGDSNSALIENMSNAGLIKDSRVKEAFLKVDRAHYALSSPYEDSPQVIGHGATISAPHMHASAVEHLISYVLPTAATPSRRILDIGSGSGYLTQILAELAGRDGRVVGLEHIQELRDLGLGNMSRSEDGRRFLDEGRVQFCVGDGRQGWVDRSAAEETDGSGYWDAIHVGASAKEVHPELLRQLKSPGCIFIPVNDDQYGDSQHVWKIEKDAQGKVSKTRLFGVRYVPLTDAPSRR